MEVHLKMDDALALTLRPMRKSWPHGDSMVLHAASAKLSCALGPDADRERILAWLEHLVPENGHRQVFRATASKGVGPRLIIASGGRANTRVTSRQIRQVP